MEEERCWCQALLQHIEISENFCNLPRMLDEIYSSSHDVVSVGRADIFSAVVDEGIISAMLYRRFSSASIL